MSGTFRNLNMKITEEDNKLLSIIEEHYKTKAQKSGFVGKVTQIDIHRNMWAAEVERINTGQA